MALCAQYHCAGAGDGERDLAKAAGITGTSKACLHSGTGDGGGVSISTIPGAACIAGTKGHGIVDRGMDTTPVAGTGRKDWSG
mmetsp:Transcript_41010/g.96366  ORF Transcript_41010/g.96366 Transcript_41010/m.96366 type:complete len:83 (-) Transcript_41010:102-350(-)